MFVKTFWNANYFREQEIQRDSTVLLNTIKKGNTTSFTTLAIQTPCDGVIDRLESMVAPGVAHEENAWKARVDRPILFLLLSWCKCS